MDEDQIHGTVVAAGGSGVLLRGAPGAGKSRLALALMALGGALVADDRVDIRVDGGRLVASAPPVLRGRIEARGVGILKGGFRAEVALSFVVCLDRAADGRLPPPRHWCHKGVTLREIRAGGLDNVAPAIYLLLTGYSLES